MSTWAPASGVCVVTPGVGGTKNPENADRYRPFSVARVHVGAWSFSSAYPCSIVRSPAVTTRPIPIAQKPTRFMFGLLSYAMCKICVRGTSRLFRGALQQGGLQDISPHKEEMSAPSAARKPCRRIIGHSFLLRSRDCQAVGERWSLGRCPVPPARRSPRQAWAGRYHAGANGAVQLAWNFRAIAVGFAYKSGHNR